MADPRHTEPTSNGAADAPSSKRQRRPSVRLGEIGEQPAAAAFPLETYLRRCNYHAAAPLDPKHRRGGAAKRARSGWAAKAEEGGEVDEAGNCSDGARWGDSGSPLREHSASDRVEDKIRVPGNKEEPSETGGRGWGKDSVGDDGVRPWLEGLGLGRYAAVFEIHEVDEEVLPLLTLEDLKEMGISTVGTRMKMYSAIQKLGRSAS